MTALHTPTRVCLNCGPGLQGRYCSACGQRALAAYPSVAEMIGDAWQELSGYDGRIVRTLRVLVRRPGELTVDTLEGRRARYISPVRLYLIASLVYFVSAALVPNLRTPAAATMPRSRINIQMDGSGRVSGLTAENREQVARNIIVLGIFDLAAALAIVGYGLLASHRVYRESWPRLLAKSVGIAVLYALTGLTALIVTMGWVTRVT